MIRRTFAVPALRRLAPLWALLGVVLLLAGCGAPEGTFQMPPQSSEHAKSIDWVYYFIFWLNVFYFVHIMALMAWFMWRYRRRPGVPPQPSPNHNLALEVGWSLPPILLCCVMFYFGFTGYIELTTPPSDAYKVEVIAKKWDWTFVYPNGGKSTDLRVLEGDTFQMVMESNDVLHSFFIPRFRVKQDVVPGRFTSVWFRPTEPSGDTPFHLFCTEYCGTQHSTMKTGVTVYPKEQRAEFEAWVDGLIAPPDGRTLFQLNCQSCHMIDGVATVGPTFRGMFGSQREVFDPATGQTKTITADEAYLRESIVEPGKLLSRVGREFTDMMSGQSFGQRLSPEEIDLLVEFLKEQK